ncbi:MAG: hypothetical protein K2H74_04460 [Paramuribaculum sp.]|nr:hypothetical protein [Paramuribaculum sp.]
MHKIFKIVPKRARQINGESLSPAMEVVVTTNNYTNNPFNSLTIDQVIDTYKRIYGFDYRKCSCMPTDFDFYPLD